MSKQLLAKSVSKVFPVIGGLVSGGLSYATFGPMAKKLAKDLRFHSKVFKNTQETVEKDKE